MKSEYDKDIHAMNEKFKQCVRETTEKTSVSPSYPAAYCQPNPGVTVLLIILPILFIMSVLINVYQCYKSCKLKKQASENVDTEQSPTQFAYQEVTDGQQGQQQNPDDPQRNGFEDVNEAMPIPTVAANVGASPRGVLDNDPLEGPDDLQQDLDDLQLGPDDPQQSPDDLRENSDDSEESRPLLPRPDARLSVHDASNSQPERIYDTILDKACLILEESIGSREDDLDHLMRHVFGFSYKRCDDIRKNSNDVTSNLRHALSIWKRIQGNKATPEALVDALAKHNWNDEADKIAKAYNFVREEVKTDNGDTELDMAIKICERLITEDIPGFVRNCLEIYNVDTKNRKSVQIIRDAFMAWKRKHSSGATVDLLVEQLQNEYMNVVDEIHRVLNIRTTAEKSNESHSKSLSEEGGDENQQAKKAFSGGGTQDNKAGPIYPPGSHQSQKPVRETTQPTSDASIRSGNQNQDHNSSQDEASSENKRRSITVPKQPYQSAPLTATYDDCDEGDRGTIKDDRERYEDVHVDVDVVMEPGAGGGKAVNEGKEE